MTVGVFIPALMAVGILVSAAVIVVDWLSALLPSRAVRRRQQVTEHALGAVLRIAGTVGAPVAPLPLAHRVARARRVYVVVAVSFAVLAAAIVRFGEDLYEDPFGWLHLNPWTLGIGWTFGGVLVVLAAISLIPAFVTLRSARVVRALVEHTWLGKPVLPPDDPQHLVARERSSP